MIKIRLLPETLFALFIVLRKDARRQWTDGRADGTGQYLRQWDACFLCNDPGDEALAGFTLA